MKENNKFSLSAFFCSLGSKSKIFMFFLLGAPFFLVQFFTLKVCASSVAVSGADGLLVTPSGGINSPIHNVLKMDTGSINSSIWVALGLDPLDLYDIMEDANEAYQDGNQVVYDSIIESLNEQDSGSGDLLDYVIQSSFQASSQSGYVGKISIPDDVWNRVNKASKNGLNIRYNNPNSNSTSISSATDIYNLFVANGYNHYSGQDNGFSLIYQLYSTDPTYVFFKRHNNSRNMTDYVFCVNCHLTGTTILPNSGSTFPILYYNIPDNSTSSSATYNANVGSQSDSDSGYGPMTIISSSSSSVVSKHIGVASDFITNKANENYDVVSKSSTYNPDTGKIEGARSINLITPEYLSQLVASLRDGILSLPEALQRLGIGAIDTDQAIPIGVGFDIDTLSHVVAQSVPQEATAAATREAFEQLDNFTFYTPDDFIGVPSVSPLPVAMNWLAVQMQTMMGLTSFQNCWVVLSTLAVLSLLVGIIRLSK